MPSPTLTAAQTSPAPPAPTTSESSLRERARQLVAEAPEEQLRTVIAYFEVALGKPRTSIQEAPSPAPPVPASLIRPSDEELARQLNERRHDPRPTVSREEMIALMSERFA